ncbi:Bifunctional transcriptional activator/DNA repair enzyme Ada [Tepidimonas charontis]|uniref:methylated-DNA--[protein]-cysteine S-methyltransferase n=1 Tax=Tepidimonas charontis TaxID=2267262 RepID=A0A554XHR1_9BURK|nr:Bifunctional transcriptional activator/DNA repair enzyme Ada [Tepidimonas charontis]
MTEPTPHRTWTALAPCRWGWALITGDADGVRTVWLVDDADTAHRAARRDDTFLGDTAKGPVTLTDSAPAVTIRPHPEASEGRPPTALLTAILAALDDPVTAHLQPLPLAPIGTPFQQRVWAALRAIPAGQTVSYGALAHTLGLPHGARAVARACAANPLAVLIPCHRVVAAHGRLTGYRWGLERKRALLATEAAATHGG